MHFLFGWVGELLLLQGTSGTLGSTSDSSTQNTALFLPLLLHRVVRGEDRTCVHACTARILPVRNMYARDCGGCGYAFADFVKCDFVWTCVRVDLCD